MAGKRKVPMSRIENDRSRMVSFSKRRKNLFNNAAELSVLTGARNAGRPHSFVSSPSVSVDSPVGEFLSASSSTRGFPEGLGHGHGDDSLSFSVEELLSDQAAASLIGKISESLGDGDSPSISVDDSLSAQAVPGASAFTDSSIGDFSVSLGELLGGDFSESFGDLVESDFFESLCESEVLGGALVETPSSLSVEDFQSEQFAIDSQDCTAPGGSASSIGEVLGRALRSFSRRRRSWRVR